MAIVYKRVPMFGYADRQFQTADKWEGRGYDLLGKREIYGIALHRALGTLLGTDGWFGRPDVASLTDYGIGVAAIDGSRSGHIYKWNDPEGYRSGWASGPVSAPYGDGLLFVNKYGINAVNRFICSIEISGNQTTPVDEFALNELVHFIAWHADQKEISYKDFPIYHKTGMSFLFYHDEFTWGTGKRCPFEAVKALIGEIIKRVKAMLQKYQETTVAGPIVTPPKPAPVEPVKEFHSPKPVRELALLDPTNEDNVAALQVVNGVEFRAVFDEVEAIRQTHQKRYAIDGPLSDTNVIIGHDIPKGGRAYAMYAFKNSAGTRYLYLSNHARVLEDDFKRIKD